MSSPQTSPTAEPQLRTTTTEQTGIHYSSIYLHTVPGTLKVICMVMKDPSSRYAFILSIKKLFSLKKTIGIHTDRFPVRTAKQ